MAAAQYSQRSNRDNVQLLNALCYLQLLLSIVQLLCRTMVQNPIPELDGNFYDLEGVQKLCRISSHILLTSVETDDFDLQGTYHMCIFIQTSKHVMTDAAVMFYDAYATMLIDIDVTVQSGRIAKLREIMRYCWFKAMGELEQLELEPHMENYQTLENWRIIGTKLGIRFARYRRPPIDPDNVYTGDILCHWSDCLCHEMVPCHSLRGCRGCWKVFYCSKSCQKR